MKEPGLYHSRSTAKSLWQKYHIFKNRVEFDTHLGKLVIPFDKIESVRVAQSDLQGLAHGDLQLKDFRPALKLDWANFVEHVVVDKSAGIRRILFTPEDPAEFKNVLDTALLVYRAENKT